MTKEILIGGQAVAMRSSAYIPILYRSIFKSDFFKDFETIADKDGNVKETDPVMQLGYTLAVHAGEKKDYEQWMSQFEFMDFMNALTDIILFWSESMETTSTAKKKSVPLSES